MQTNGRIAALLELGSGFTPEFTGRENVYMNGATLGLTREEIDQRYDDIAALADNMCGAEPSYSILNDILCELNIEISRGDKPLSLYRSEPTVI